MSLNLDEIESAIFDNWEKTVHLQFKPSPIFYLSSLFEEWAEPDISPRRAYLKAKRRWFRDYREEITWMRAN